ncbi:MAG: hypothetical protein JXD19_09825 [Deltaproteobacteria bacterium]|nr:hypothetical protein [Deltaproteobacteria bacterium]
MSTSKKGNIDPSRLGPSANGIITASLLNSYYQIAISLNRFSLDQSALDPLVLHRVFKDWDLIQEIYKDPASIAKILEDAQ